MAKVCIFLVTAALIAGMVGCGGESYALAIASTEGGSVTTPGEGMFIYDEGMVVNLVAEADEGYQFVNWTGNVSAIADVNAAATNITMNGDYSITANFAPEIPENLEIRTWYDLDAIGNNLSGSYLLMNDLDSTTAGYEELASPTANQGKGWQPIGTFTGTFDGQGYEIRDLFINRPDEWCVALFVIVDEGGCIEDIGVVNATVTGYEYVGGLVGENGGTVSDSYSTGNVTGNSLVGGLVGDKAGEGSVSNSFWDIETSGQTTSDGGTGNTTAGMKNIATFSGAGWNITAVANPGTRNPSYIWNIVNGVTYPFLSWQS